MLSGLQASSTRAPAGGRDRSAPPAGEPVPDVFIARQPILHVTGRLHGYELLFRTADGASDAPELHNGTMAAASIAVAALSEIGLKALVGDAIAYLAVDRGFLLSDMVEALPARKVALEFDPSLEFDDATIRRCKQLRAAGYRLAIDDFRAGGAPREILQLADVVKVDIAAGGIDGLRKVTREVPSTDRLLADHVEQIETAQECRKLGVGLFQGHYFSKPATVSGKRLDVEARGLLKVLTLLLGDAPDAQIVQALKMAPQLVFRLLRIVNSAAYGFRKPIDSLQTALFVVGRTPFARLIQMLLFTRSSSWRSPALLESAAARGRLMELLWLRHHPNDDTRAEAAFITGLFSLLDAALDTPMAELVESVALPPGVREALMGDTTSPYFAHLETAKLLETDRPAEALGAIEPVVPKLPPAQLARLQRDSLVWATRTSHAMAAT